MAIAPAKTDLLESYEQMLLIRIFETEAERRSCAVAAELTDDVTFLGAHAVPSEYEGRADEYVELVCGERAAQRAVREPERRGSIGAPAPEA